jgi:ankyrin repeat protein
MSTSVFSYQIMVSTSSAPDAQLVQKTLNAYEYARELQRDYIADLIHHRANLSPYEQRFFRTLQLNDVRRCDTFLRRLLNEKRQHDVAARGLFYAAELGSIRLLDYFLTRWKININTQQEDQTTGYLTTALLTAITHNQNEAAKFILFRNADPSIKGQYDNALVTALHYQSANDLLRLLLDKSVDLTARHPDYKNLTLREYCVLTNRVKPKTELDAYIIRLINTGNYQRLKWLVDHGYTYINVHVKPKCNAKQLAKDRYYEKIVKLIDGVEDAQMKAKMKMNY